MWNTTTTYDTQYVITDFNKTTFILYKSTIAAIEIRATNILVHLTNRKTLTLIVDGTKRQEIFDLLVSKNDNE